MHIEPSPKGIEDRSTCWSREKRETEGVSKQKTVS
jgi:hypothetical protein